MVFSEHIVRALFPQGGLVMQSIKKLDAARMELWGKLHKSYNECKLCLCRVFTLARMASLAQQRLAHKQAKLPHPVHGCPRPDSVYSTSFKVPDPRNGLTYLEL